jgi:hypothetical protein
MSRFLSLEYARSGGVPYNNLVPIYEMNKQYSMFHFIFLTL